MTPAQCRRHSFNAFDLSSSYSFQKGALFCNVLGSDNSVRIDVQFAGVIIRQQQAFALGKGRRTLAFKSQFLVGQQAALSGPPLFFFWSFASSMVLDGKLLQLGDYRIPLVRQGKTRELNGMSCIQKMCAANLVFGSGCWQCNSTQVFGVGCIDLLW